MATDPATHPLDDEIEAILAADPDLLSRLDQAREAYKRGDLAVVESVEVARRLRALGSPIE